MQKYVWTVVNFNFEAMSIHASEGYLAFLHVVHRDLSITPSLPSRWRFCGGSVVRVFSEGGTESGRAASTSPPFNR